MSRHAHRPDPRIAQVTGAVAGVALLLVAVVALTGSGGGSDAKDGASTSTDPTLAAPADPSEPESSRSKGVESPAGTTRKKPQKVIEAGPPIRRSQAYLTAMSTATFRVSSFNVLGASHTNGKGRRARYSSGSARMHSAVDLLREQGVSVAGLQEFEPPQYAVLRSRMPSFEVYPGPQFRVIEMTNSIIWDTTQWELLSAETLPIPYFYGQAVRMPHVLLRHLETGKKVWFANYHNPADVRGNAAGARNAAKAMQADLANQLTADGTPLIMTGDFNEREEFFCTMTARTSLKSANGGGQGSPCVPPDNMNVDWIMGSDEIEFDGFLALDGGFIEKITDHPVIFATATVPPQPFP